MSHFALVKGPKPHTHSVWLYWGVFFTLVVLTVVTVVIATYDFGKFNTLVALTIASTKALLVVGIFMHLAFDNKFFGVVASTSLVLLALFIVFPLVDMNTRVDLDAEQANFLPRNEQVHKHRLASPESLPLRPGLQEADKNKLIFEGPHGH